MTRPSGSGPFCDERDRQRLRLFFAALALTLVLVVAAPAAAPAASWTGSWSTTYGTMTLTQTGPSVSGNYDYASGQISGSVSANTLSGTWTEGANSGPFSFTMSADGLSFTGVWSYAGNPAQNSWRGTRTTPIPPDPGPPVIADPPNDPPVADSKLGKHIRSFADRFALDLQKDNLSKRARALQEHSAAALGALRQLRAADADEREAKRCVRAAYAAFAKAGGLLVKAVKAAKRGQRKKTRAYVRAYLAQISKAAGKMACALRHLPVKADRDPPPEQDERDSIKLIGFYPLDPLGGGATVLPADAVKPSTTMSACGDRKVLSVAFEYTVTAGSTVSVHWTLPSGQVYNSTNTYAGPRAGTGSQSIFYTNGAPLPNGTYRVEFRAGGRELANVWVSRSCSG